jgi:ABC-type sugar transport system ATPase subunit
MSGGQQQMLAIGRARMAWPRLLMLDRPGDLRHRRRDQPRGHHGAAGRAEHDNEHVQHAYLGM